MHACTVMLHPKLSHSLSMRHINQVKRHVMNPGTGSCFQFVWILPEFALISTH